MTHWKKNEMIKYRLTEVDIRRYKLSENTQNRKHKRIAFTRGDAKNEVYSTQK